MHFMYTAFNTNEPDYFNQTSPVTKQDNSYYYDGERFYQQPYISGQDPCQPIMSQQSGYNPSSRRYMGNPQQQNMNYNSQTPNYFGGYPIGNNNPTNPQYFSGGTVQESRRYTPYTRESFSGYEAPQENGLNVNLFNRQTGYSNPINQNPSQQYPQHQLIKVNCPQQINGFRTNEFTAPKMPADPCIDWGRLNDVNKNGVMPKNTFTPSNERLFGNNQSTGRSWAEIARDNFK
jgi:hypothetical protein